MLWSYFVPFNQSRFVLLNYFENDVIALGVCTESKVHKLQVKYDSIEQMNNKLRLI